MLVALERFDLRIPACGSLKEKRHVVKTLTSGIRSTFNVSVAEVDHQGHRSRITVVTRGTPAVIVQIKRGSTVLETFNFAAAGAMPPLVLRDTPYYQTATNEALVINLSGAVQVNGVLEYAVSSGG